MKSTTEQIIASDPQYSVWVSANAGTGKTKLLIDRILRLLIIGVKPSKILCLTYTNNAASEMQERIHHKIQEWQKLNEDELSQKLEDLLGIKQEMNIIQKTRFTLSSLIPSNLQIKITTIHAYCQNILTQFPLEANISTEFNIATDQQKSLLLNQIQPILLEKIYHNNPTIKQAIDDISLEMHYSSFEQLLQNIINKTNDFKKTISLYNNDIQQISNIIYDTLQVKKTSSALEIINHYLESDLDHSLLLYIYDIMKAEPTLKSNDSKAFEFLVKYELYSKNNKEQRNYNDIIISNLKKLYLTCPQSKICKARSTVISKSIISKCSQYPNIEKLITQQQSNLLDLIEQLSSLKIAKLSSHIIHIAEVIINIYNDLKAKSNLLDFNDIIQKILFLLKKSTDKDWVLYNIDNEIDHIMLDEAQDTNVDQWEIINLITKEFFNDPNHHKTIFVVGDEKQSIFSFQGAKHSLFHNQYLYYKEVLGNIPHHELKFINLIKSFRSTPKILELVDNIFNLDSIKPKVIIDHSYPIKHHATKSLDLPSEVEIWEPIKDIKDEEQSINDILDEDWEFQPPPPKNSLAEKELAEKIIIKIKELLQNVEYNIQEKDIMILFRKQTSSLMKALVQELNEHDIKNTGCGNTDLFQHIAIKDLISLGEFVLLPDYDLQLANIIKSPILNLSENDLFQIAHNRKELSIYQQIQLKAEYSDTYQKLKDFIWHSQYYDAHNFYLYIIEKYNLREIYSKKYGNIIQRYFDSFLHICYLQTLEDDSLQDLIRILKNYKFTIKSSLNPSENSIKLLTVHGSKGLQAKVIFLPDTSFKNKSSQEGVFLDINMEENLRSISYNPFFIWLPHSQYLTKFTLSLKEDQQKIEKNEELRLLYVALTRAENHLYITSIKKQSSSSESWYNLILSPSINDSFIIKE